MTLGEVMIASSVLLVCLTSLAGVLGMSVNSSRMARARDEATNLANAKIEYARSLAYDEVGLHYANGAYGDPAGDIVTPETVGSFTVVTECTWVRTDTGRAAYKKLVVHVSWQQPIAGEIALTTMIYGKSDMVTSGDLDVRLRYRENADPVVNATVAIVSSTNSARSVLSDASGEAFFGQVAIGSASMTVIPPAGWVVDTSSVPSVTISADSVQTIIVFLQRPAQATVRVADTSGNPVPGADVSLRRADGTVLPTVLTNASGDAVFSSLLYADYTATISKTGYPSATAPFSVSAEVGDPIVPVTISPLLGVGIQVCVYDANSTPIAAATVTVRLDGSSTPVQTGSSGTNGEISFTGLVAGNYNVTVEKSGLATQVLTTHLYDGDHDTLTFHMSQVVSTGNMHVVTLDKNGHATSIRVIVSGPNGYYRNDLYSNGDGVLDLQSLVPGSYQVQCYTKPASVATAIVNAGQTAQVQISQRR
jgi:type II secretory pathway pseudopilin PulG